jgi:hypothetical protein
MGGLYFDPQAADFTLRVQHFKDEVYRNWIVPQNAYFNFKRHVDLAFVVERDHDESHLLLQRVAVGLG